MNTCKQCGDATDNPRFCSRSCAVTHNNQGVRRHGRQPKDCIWCGTRLRSSTQKYCDQKCQANHKKKQIVDKWLETGKCAIRANNSIRDYVLSEQGNVCDICGLEPTWNGEPITFVFDHIDGNSRDSSRENVRMICPNCDSQTPTYKSRNIGNGRHYRRERYKKGQSY